MGRYVVREQCALAELRGEAAQAAASRGRRVSESWEMAAEAAGAVCLGEVSDERSAAAAVLAAVHGADLVIAANAAREVIDTLCDDLRRLGELHHAVGAPVPAARLVAALDPEVAALVAELMAGRTLGEAARRLHLSRRTADRRLAAAKAAFGVSTTAEVLVRAADAGLAPAASTLSARPPGPAAPAVPPVSGSSHRV